MNIYTDSQINVDEFPTEVILPSINVESIQASPLPEPHPAEQDTFARHEGVPGHHQKAIQNARIVLVGAGGLNSWVAIGLVRGGAQNLTIIDPDFIDRTNLPRQLYYADDLGKSKATRLIQNLVAHSVSGANITGISKRFETAAEEFTLPADLLVIGVDRNDCRLFGAKLARARRIPAVFTMLSKDGMRTHTFFQGPSSKDACLWCALPNLDPEKSTPCASAIISSCFLASAFTLFFVHRAVMGWPNIKLAFNWREADLLGIAPDRTGYIKQRDKCKVCGQYT